MHFSARKDGAYIDAETLHLDALTVLPSAERAIFNRVKEKHDELLEAVALPPALPPQLIAAAPAASEGDMHGDEADEDGDNAQAAAPRPPIPEAVVAAPGQPATPAVAE